MEQLQACLNIPVMEFLDQIYGARKRGLVTCTQDNTLGEVMELAAQSKVHRVWAIDDQVCILMIAHNMRFTLELMTWVTEKQGCLVGLVSLSDMIAAVRRSLLAAEQQLP